MRKSLSHLEAVEIVQEKCKEKNYEFLGFCDKEGNEIEYSGVDKTFVKLKCLTCNNIWNTTTFANFRKGIGCSICGRKRTIASHRIDIDSIHTIIRQKCQEHKYEFLGFCDREGNEIEYHGIYTYLKLKCNHCGNIWYTTTFDNLKRNRKCPQCALILKGNKKRTKPEEYLTKIQEICDKYNYEFLGFCDREGNESKLFLTQATTYLKLKCNNCGNIWKSTSYDSFIRHHHCPKCNENKLEDKLRRFFRNNNIQFEEQKKFSWLKFKKALSLDFYLPQYNCAIECQGIQHFKINDFFGGKKKYQEQLERDKIKKKLCEDNGIKLLYYSNLGIEYPYEVIEDEELFLKYINY